MGRCAQEREQNSEHASTTEAGNKIQKQTSERDAEQELEIEQAARCYTSGKLIKTQMHARLYLLLQTILKNAGASTHHRKSETLQYVQLIFNHSIHFWLSFVHLF